MNSTPDAIAIGGACDTRFKRVRDAFAHCLETGLEHGGAVAVVVDGKTLVDVWGGHADAARTRPWQRDTLVNAWSVTKGVVALAVAMRRSRTGTSPYSKAIAMLTSMLRHRGSS